MAVDRADSLDANNSTFKTGYELSATDRLQVTLELMNVSPHPRAVVLTVEYDVVPLPLLPADWNTTRITPIWLDVTGVCGQSEFPVPIGGYQVFNVATPEPAWKSTVAGDVVFAGGHLHDGGTNIKVLQRGKEICNSVATYGGDPAFIDGGTGLEGVVQDHHHDEGEEDGHGHEEDEKDGHGHDEDEKDGHGHGEDEKDGHGHEEGEKDGHSHEESEGHEHAPGTPSTPHSHDDDGHSHGTPSSAAPPPPAATTTAPGRHDHGGHSHRRRHQRRQHGHGSGGESHKPPMAHISDMTVCVAAGKIAKGDELALMAQYDLARHSAMAGHREGELEPIMGIAIVLVAVPVVGA